MSRKRLLGLAILALVIAGFSHTCVPVSRRLTAPIVCPANTAESVVVTWTSSDGKGKSRLASDLHCIDAEGGGRIPSSNMTFTVVLGYAVAVVLVLMAVLASVRAIRRRRSKG